MLQTKKLPENQRESSGKIALSEAILPELLQNIIFKETKSIVATEARQFCLISSRIGDKIDLGRWHMNCS